MPYRSLTPVGVQWFQFWAHATRFIPVLWGYTYAKAKSCSFLHLHHTADRSVRFRDSHPCHAQVGAFPAWRWSLVEPGCHLRGLADFVLRHHPVFLFAHRGRAQRPLRTKTCITWFTFGFVVDYLFLSFAPNIGLLFLGRVVAGVMGASFTTAGAYIADVSTPENRAQNFGLIGAAFGLGFHYWSYWRYAGNYGEHVPFMVAAGLSFLNWLYGFFILPESLKPENRRHFDWKRANPAGTW